MIDIILGNEIPDPKRQDERHDQAADRNGAETRFRGEVIVEIKIDADKSAVTALAVSNGARRFSAAQTDSSSGNGVTIRVTTGGASRKRAASAASIAAVKAPLVT